MQEIVLKYPATDYGHYSSFLLAENMMKSLDKNPQNLETVFKYLQPLLSLDQTFAYLADTYELTYKYYFKTNNLEMGMKFRHLIIEKFPNTIVAKRTAR